MTITSNHTLNEHVCLNLKPKTNPIISTEIYKDHIRNLEWDLGQHDFKSNLTAEHNSIMQCLFLDGFSYENMIHCLGDDYNTVVEQYRIILKHIQDHLIGSVMDYLEFRGYDNMVLDAYNDLKLKLEFDLEDSQSPWKTIDEFEQEIQGKLPSEMSDLTEFRHEFQSHYVIYLSFKRMMKAYIFLTVNCVREVVAIFKIQISKDFPVSKVPEDRIEQIFPDSEVEKGSDDKESLHMKVQKILRGEGDGFNHDMARQGKFKTLVAAHIASGKIAKSDLDPTMTPEQIIRKFVYGDDPNDEEEENKSHH
jgi:hypothetical protein